LSSTAGFSVAKVDTPIDIERRNKAIGEKSRFRELLQRESEHLRHITTMPTSQTLWSRSRSFTDQDIKLEKQEQQELLWMAIDWHWSIGVWLFGNDHRLASSLWQRQ
jgi:hypothetical protein